MMGTIADQFRKAGISAKQINQFDVYSISDDIVIFPEERLGNTRSKHNSRLVIILQNDKDNDNPIIKICSIAPLSTNKQYYRLDYQLKKANHQFLRDDSFVRIQHTQPILKTDLKSKFGNVADQTIRDHIKDRLFQFYNLSS